MNRIKSPDYPIYRNAAPVLLILVFFLLSVTFLYNIYGSILPISVALGGDDGEHLHVAYLLGQGERPFVDFIENHPMLFNHFLWWLHEASGVNSVRDWNSYARLVLLGHLLLAMTMVGLGAARLLSHRLQGRSWGGVLLLAWSMTGLTDPHFQWIWQLRPDHITYAYTLGGGYLVLLALQAMPVRPSSPWAIIGSESRPLLLALAGGILIGFGNAILPKGIVFLLAGVLVICSNWLLGLRNFGEDITVRKNLWVAVIAGGAMAVSFISGMLLDCWLSNITVSQWLAGVFFLNSKPHTIYTIANHDPIKSIVSAFGLNLPLLLLLVMAVIWQTGRFKQLCAEDRHGEIQLGLFAFYVLVVNLLLPTYSHGVTWSYNFIPALFVAAIVYLLLVNRAGVLLLQGTAGIRREVRFCLFLVFILFFQALLPHSSEAWMRFRDRQDDKKMMDAMAPADYLQETKMPTDLVYLSQFPYQAPVKARHWGYYHMLVLDHGFWKDCHRLGLGPDPAAWIDEFKADPPDILVLALGQMLLEYGLALRKCQGIDGSLFLREVQEKYQKMTTPGLGLYVRKDHVPKLQALGWRLITEKLDR